MLNVSWYVYFIENVRKTDVQRGCHKLKKCIATGPQFSYRTLQTPNCSPILHSKMINHYCVGLIQPLLISWVIFNLWWDTTVEWFTVVKGMIMWDQCSRKSWFRGLTIWSTDGEGENESDTYWWWCCHQNILLYLW